MAVIETWLHQDLQEPVKVNHLDGNLFSNNGNGNRIGVVLTNNGEALASISGTVSGYVVTADGSTVPCTGSKSGNRASILIPAAAYQPGSIFITVFVTDGTTVTTIVAVSTTVMRSRTNAQVDPGSAVADWTQTINAAMQSVETAAANLGGIVAVPYASITFPVPLGKYTYYNNNLYRCITPITSSESFTAAHWTQVRLGDEVSDLKSALSKTTNYYRKGALRPGVAWNLSAHSGRMTEFIPFLPNQTFVFKTSGSVENYTGTIFYLTSEGAQSFIGSDSISFGTTQVLTSADGCGCICISFNKSSGACAASDLDGITIEFNYITANDIPGTKEADTTSESIHALVASDGNLFSIDNLEIGKSWVNQSMSSRATEFIPCMPNTPYHIVITGSMPSIKTYTFSCIQKDELNDVAMITGQDLSTGHTTITTNSNTHYLAICFNCNTTVESSDFANISVEVKPEFVYKALNTTEVFTPCSFPVLFYAAVSTGDNVAINVLLPFRMFFVSSVDRTYSYVQFYSDNKQYVEYTVPHVSFLVFDKSDNTIKVVTGSYKESQIPLLFNHGGEPHGILESYYLQNLTIANNNVKSCLFSSRQGDIDGCPENSLAGFARAKYRGFDIVRASLSFTSDGVGVLCHDETINSVARNADGTTISDTVYVAESTYDELLEYDFGIKMGSGYAGTKITKLEDFLKQCKQLGQIPQLELKFGVTNANLDNAIDIVEKLMLSGVVEWHSDPIAYLEYIKSKHDFATIGLIRNSNGGQSWSLSTNDIDEAIALKNGKNKVRVVTAKATPIVGSVIRYASRNNIEIKVASEYFTFDNFDLLVNTYSEVECAGIRHPKMYMFAKHYRYTY